MTIQPGAARSFAGFWERKLLLSLSSYPGRGQPWWGSDPVAADLERRRVRAWTTAFYGGPIRSPRLEVQPVLDFITEASHAWAEDGRRLDRLHCEIPVELHRLWCESLVAPADGSGWPMWAGISVKAEVYLQAPRDWVPGMDVTERDDDMAEIWASHRGHAVARRFWLPPGSDPAALAIYQRLRTDDEMSRDDAAEAALLLASIHRP